MKTIFLFFLFTLLLCERLIKVTGTPFERGKQIGEKLKDSIDALYDNLLVVKSKELDRWRELAQYAKEGIKLYAPNAYEEIQGMIAAGVSKEKIYMLNCANELEFDGLKQCTGFSAFHNNLLITGQTNDENINDWILGKYDVVLNLNDEILVYTHPGIVGYMGINKDGIVVLWQDIDNGERNLDDTFLPATVLIRELLSHSNMFEIIEYLKSVKLGGPNNFIISKGDDSMMNVELGPTNMTILYQPLRSDVDIAHANNLVFSQQMLDGDIDFDETSKARFKFAREEMKRFRSSGGITEEKAKKMMDTYPIKRNGTVVALSTLVFSPSSKKLSIKFYKEDEYNDYFLP